MTAQLRPPGVTAGLLDGAAAGSPVTAAPDRLADRVVVVRHGRRPVGLLVQGDGVRWEECPRPRRGRLVIVAAAVAGATAVGLRWATRPARIGPITMGPGGWVSVKGAKPAADPSDRPLWARLLRSYRV